MAWVRVNKESPIPLHAQLLNQLRQLILSGEWEPHQRLPSEPELVEQLGVSRTTVRQSLAAAQRERLIYRVAGKGTFVETHPTAETPRLVGFVIPHFRSSFDSDLLLGVEQVLKARGYQVLFCNSERRLEEENRVLAGLLRDRVEGIVIWPVYSDDLSRELYRLSVRDFPMVLLDRTFPYLETDCVLVDNVGGGCAATRHLLQLGHRRIAFLARPFLHLLPIAERLAGYRQAMREAGLEALPPMLAGEAYEPDTGGALRAYGEASGSDIEALMEQLAQPNRPTAIFAMNDLMALQVLRAAARVGLSVPGDLSVVGFDNLEVVSHLLVPLTTVAQSPRDLGATAAQLLLDRLHGGRSVPQQHHLPAELRVRATTGPPPTTRKG